MGHIRKIFTKLCYPVPFIEKAISRARKRRFQENHRISWRDAAILYRDNKVGNRRLVEGACINACKSMEGNKPFTQEDYFVDKKNCSVVIKDLNLINSHHIANPDAVILSRSGNRVGSS